MPLAGLDGAAVAGGVSGLSLAPREHAYDIPAQPLNSAVEAFAVSSGVQVIYDRPRGAQPRSHPVQGVLPPRAALKRLLEGTGLVARFVDAEDAVLAPAPASAASPSLIEATRDNAPRLVLAPLRVQSSVVLEVKASGADQTRLYARTVQNQLQQALSVDPRTSHGNYDAGLELWIGSLGDVRQVGIAQTSGEAERDAAILGVVHRVVIDDAPPKDMAQPIQVAVHSRVPAR